MDAQDKDFLKKNNFEFIDIIGKGGYGVILYVYSPQYSRNFALKKIPVNRFRQAEIDCLRMIDDHNIVNLYQYYYYCEYVYLLMEFCPTTVDKIVKTQKCISGKDLINYTISILRGVKACHERNISHNDIKPSNFLIDQYGRVKVGDFGLSCIHAENELSGMYGGSLGFVAPEVFNRKPYDAYKADVWSLGVTFYFMATGRLPWHSQTKEGLINCIRNVIVDYSQVYDKNYALLISRCLRIDPSMRPSVNELLNTPILAKTAQQSNSVIMKPIKGGMISNSKKNRIGKIIVKPTQIKLISSASFLNASINKLVC
jgi:serine/threonine protein kinase